VLQAIVDVTRKAGSTTLLVTHNADIARLADRVIRFADGGIRSIETNTERAQPTEIDW
jgi:putative ABC transport system ATP-binding protein